MTMVKDSPPRRGGELLLRTWRTLIERHIQHQDIYARFAQETEIRSFRILRDQRLHLIHRDLANLGDSRGLYVGICGTDVWIKAGRRRGHRIRWDRRLRFKQ